MTRTSRGFVIGAIAAALAAGVAIGGQTRTERDARAAEPWQIRTFEAYVAWNDAITPANEFLATLDPACDVSMALSTFGSTGTGRLVAVTYRC